VPPALDSTPWQFEKAAPPGTHGYATKLDCHCLRCSLPSLPSTPSPGPGAVGGGQALVAICDGHGLDDAVSVLDTYLNTRD
jgi:hypothetical protein